MFQTIIGAVSSFMYSKLLVIILIGAGLYFTIRKLSKFASFFYLKADKQRLSAKFILYFSIPLQLRQQHP